MNDEERFDVIDPEFAGDETGRPADSDFASIGDDKRREEAEKLIAAGLL